MKIVLFAMNNSPLTSFKTLRVLNSATELVLTRPKHTDTPQFSYYRKTTTRDLTIKQIYNKKVDNKMLEKETIKELFNSIEIYTHPNAPFCPICSTPLMEDWSEDIGEDGEIYEYEIYACEECEFQESI